MRAISLILPPKHERFLQALLSSETKADAIAKSGLGETTAYKLLRDVDFAAEYRRRQAELVTCALQEAQKQAKDAVRIIHEVARSVDTPATARISAAKAILDYAIKGVELERNNRYKPEIKTWEEMIVEMSAIPVPCDDEE